MSQPIHRASPGLGLVLLSDPYGWRPLPAEIPADEYDQILAHLSGEQMAEQRALLKAWYLRDDNARYRRNSEVYPTELPAAAG